MLKFALVDCERIRNKKTTQDERMAFLIALGTGRCEWESHDVFWCGQEKRETRMKLTRDMWCRAGKWIGICLTAMAFGWIALAQAVSTTTVQGTVYLANGQPGSGTLQLSWPAFTTSNNLAVAAGRTTVSIGSDGFVSVNLAPNLGSSPAGLYYTAVYHMSDGTTSTEYWVVPAAAQATIASVRSQVMPAAQAVQAVSKAYVDQAIESLAGSLSPVGGTLTSPLYLSGDPSQPLQAADKHYVDETYSAAVPLSGGNMVGALTAPSVTASLNKVLLVTAAPYNAKCDGATDDQAAIQAAFNDAIRYGSFQVQFPAGTCLTSTIMIQGQSFFGAGKNATTIKGEPGQDVFQGYDPSSGNTMFQHARIHDMTILVDGTVDTSATAAGGNNTYPFRVTGTAGGLTALASPPAPGPLAFSPAINNCAGQIIADGGGLFDEFYLPCASFTMIGAFPVVGAPITIYDSTGTTPVLSTTIKSVVDDQHLILKASVSSAQSNLTGTFLNAHTPPWYIGSCGIALPMKDGNTGNGNTSLNDWSFENVNFTVTGGIPRQSAHTCAIFVQNNNYGMHYLHINTSLQYAGIVEALPYQNVGYITWTPDTTQYYDVNLGHHILPLITYNGTHRVFDGVSIYGGAWDSPGGMGLWALEANTGGNAGLPAYSTDASFVRYYWECFGLLSGEMERFSGVSTTFTGGSTSQCGAYNNLGPNIVPPFVNWHVSDGIFAGQIGGGLQINGDHSTLVDTEITTSSAVTDNGFENKVISSSNTSDPLQKREFYANPGMAQEPVGKVNGDFLLNGNSGSPFVSGSDLLTTCRDYRVLTSMCVNDPNGAELVKSYIHAPATGGTVSGISTGSVAVWNYLMVAGSRIPLAPIYVVAQGRCEGASSCSSLFIVRDRVTGNTIGSCNYTFGSSWTIQGGPTTSPCLVNFSSVPAGDAVGWDTNSWTASGLTAVDISFVGFQPQSTDLVNEVVASGQLASLSTANAQAFAGPINVSGNVNAGSFGAITFDTTAHAAATRTNLGVPSISVLDYGVVADAQIVSDGAMSSGSTTLTSASGLFAASAVGKTISVQYAGGTGGSNQPLVTTVAAYVSPTQVTLAAAATQAVSAAGVLWGTDNYSKFNLWVAALPGSRGLIPCQQAGGAYLVNVQANTLTLHLGSSETIDMDRSCSIYFVGAHIGTQNSLFTIPNNAQNVAIDGLHVVGEFQNTSSATAIRFGFGDGSAIGMPNSTGSSTTNNVKITNGIFANLIGMALKDLNTEETDINFEHNRVVNIADTGANLNTGDSSVSFNSFANLPGAMEVSGMHSHYNFNRIDGATAGGNYAIQAGGVTSGAPYVGSEIIGNVIINPAGSQGCISVGDGFTYGIISNNQCLSTTGSSTSGFGIVNAYAGHVTSGNNHISHNTVTSAATAGIFLNAAPGDVVDNNVTSGAYYGLEAWANFSSSKNTWSGGGPYDAALGFGAVGDMQDTLAHNTYTLAGGGTGGTITPDTEFHYASGGTSFIGATNFTGPVNLAGSASPLLLNGSAGTSGQYVTSAGPGATPTWSTFSFPGTLTSPLTINALLTLNTTGTQLRISQGRQFNIGGNSTSLSVIDGSAGNYLWASSFMANGNECLALMTSACSSAVTVAGAISNGIATTTNTDERGTLTLVAGTASYTFHQGPGTSGVWTTAPICQIQDTSSFAHQANTSTFTVTTSTLTIGNTTNTTDVYTYSCRFGT
jgi:hypothetical protein